MICLLNAIGSARLLDAYVALRPADRPTVLVVATLAIAASFPLAGIIFTLIERAKP